MRLSDACTIHTGYTARSRLEAAAEGVLALELRNLPASGEIDPAALLRVELADLSDRYFVRSGDVVFRSRGERTTAYALDERFAEPAVAILPIMVLRPRADILAPGYLAWAINQPAAQRQFDTAARGTSVRMVSKSDLGDLRIDIPDLDTQHRIVAIDRLADREKALTLLLAEKRKAMTSLILAGRAGLAPQGAKSERT